MTRRRRADRGQILVIVAGGIVGIVAMLALVLEGGTLVLNRRDGQNQADLAALAGTQVIARVRTSQMSPGSVLTAVRESLERNGCVAGAGCSWEAAYVNSALGFAGTVGSGTPPGGAFGVRVGVTRRPDALVGRVFAISSWTVSTEATAITAKLSAVPAEAVLPVAICGWTSDAGETECGRASSAGEAIDFQHGQVYDLVEGKDGPFGFGWIRWDGSDPGCDLVNPSFNLDNPYDSPTGSGEVWLAASGNGLNAGARACIERWINLKSTVLVPVYDVLDRGTSGPRYHVTGVAAFVVTRPGRPEQNLLSGYFVEYYPYAAATTAAPRSLDIGDATQFLGLVK